MSKKRAVLTDQVFGALTPVGNNGYARDEQGRVFKYASVERLEAAKEAKKVGTDTRHFSFTHMQNLREIVGDLSNKHCGYILRLQPHIQFKTNALVKRGKDGDYMTLDDFAKTLKVTKRTVKAVVGELMKRDIIFEHNGHYSINERYHFRKKAGENVGVVIKTFFTTLERIDVSPADLGFVYKLLPNVHYDTNVICDDPFVDGPQDIEYLNEAQIAKLVGMSASKTKESLARLRKAGVIGEWFSGDDKREKLTVLNPYVFYRRNGMPDKTLQALFSAKRFGG
jgi:hypothetical protein